MKSISISELHARTGYWVRWVARHGAIIITERGKPIATLAPCSEGAQKNED